MKKNYHVFTGDCDFSYSSSDYLVFTPKDFEKYNLEIIEVYGYKDMFGCQVLLKGTTEELLTFLGDTAYYSNGREEDKEFIFSSKKKAWQEIRNTNEGLGIRRRKINKEK